MFFKTFLKRKNKHALIRNSTQPQMKNNYHHPIFVQYKKKSYQLIFSLPYEKTKFNKRKEKKSKKAKKIK
jgi:hypothetical protein